MFAPPPQPVSMPQSKGGKKTGGKPKTTISIEEPTPALQLSYCDQKRSQKF